MKLERKHLKYAALALRGYNITNHGKTKQLLKHSRHGKTLVKYLEQGSQIATKVLEKPVDLLQITQEERFCTLETYAEDLALIIAVELAHVEMLLDDLSANLNECKCLLGYSLGEVAAVIVTGIFTFEQAITPVLKLAYDSAELARSTTMGILFSRGPALSFEMIEKCCLEISCEGQGTLSISTYLSPNTVLLLGQHATLDVFKDRCLKLLPKGTQLRKNPHQWPPLHTPIVRHKFISNKAALLLEQTSGGFIKPSPPILSCVTGDYSYTELNCREIFVRWTESPQRLWQALHKLLEENCEIMIHLGPEPNIIPATMSRLSANVSSYMNPATWTGYGIQTLSQNSASRRWLAKLISIDSAVLRTPFVQQVVLEDEFSTQGS